jgi:hypothetical protein
MSKQPIKDRTYRLKGGMTPLSYTLQSRNHSKFPLMWYDEQKNINRVLRYSLNQKSPFEDEQDGNFILEPIVFEDGMLHVPKTNPVLQEFLYYHPHNGTIFEEVDKEREADREVHMLSIEADALAEARSLSIEQMEMLMRVMFGKDPSLVTTAEMKRDILIFAKNSPGDFLNMINDPELKFQAKIRLFFDKGLLSLRNNNKEIWFSTPTNRKKMCSIPYGDDPYTAAGSFLMSDDGIDALKMLESHLPQA